MPPEKHQLVYTLTARCRDCHRCLRVCPVNAISIANGQASVKPERCISCGACIRECPQGAKTYRRDIAQARDLIASGAVVAASVAPSFAAAFPDWKGGRFVSALRRLGFAVVAETAVGAYYSAQACAKAAGNGSNICGACPAAVNYIEKYRPELAAQIMPAASPMVAHARLLKTALGQDAKVVFIGPCVAKKSELERQDAAGAVDVALTFEEITEWLGKSGIDIASCEESAFDGLPRGDSRLYPVPGGFLKTAGLGDGFMNPAAISVTGAAEVKDALLSVPPEVAVEPLFCREGCINGPGLKTADGLLKRRASVFSYAAKAQTAKTGGAKTGAAGKFTDDEIRRACAAEFSPRPFKSGVEISEADIQRVLEQTGKGEPEQQLNCGACGYRSCREKAVAVLEGMAVPEMCIPLMRRRAEQRADRIISDSPNGIVVLDSSLSIISANPAFRTLFSCSDDLPGRRLSSVMDSAPFEKVAAGAQESVDSVYRDAPAGIFCKMLIYPLREEGQVIGIFVNMAQHDGGETAGLQRAQTVAQARELLEHQIDMAQHIAMYLGESTAKSEELVKKIIALSEEGKDGLDNTL
ncbi:MAG: 4Fe-4S binding protein [Elusimicrobia bacterium]|nr:4Fe-4S binding protein [Elusimicrobiota bacterium]